MPATVEFQAQHIEISPNCALSVPGAWAFFGSACLAPVSVAVALACKGFWPVLPFAGLELLLLGWALAGSMERRFEREAVTITDTHVRVEAYRRGCHAQFVFPRHWAQVKLRRPAARLHPSRLTIESHGRQCELGRFLTEEERQGLALRLQRLVGRIDQSPSLP